MIDAATAVSVGLDLGTSAAKAIAVDAEGAVAGRAVAGYPTMRPAPGASEQDPALWLRAVTEVVAALADRVDPERWMGIGLAAMLPTLVVLDERLTALAPAVTWEDARAEDSGDRLRRSVGEEWLYERTGQWVDGRYLLPMYERLAREEPAVAARAHHLAGAKDLLFGWLTGTLATDPSTAAGYGAYDVRAGAWLPEPRDALAAELGAPVPRLPAVRDSSHTEPLCAPAAAALGLPAGLPIALGAADSVLGALGLGVGAPGEVAYIAGTSTVILAIAERWTPDPHHRYLLTPLAEPGSYGVEMDLLSTGSAIRWLSSMLARGGDEAELVALAVSHPPDTAPAFVPYLAPGEQGALWDASLHGALAGLHLGHDGTHLARGLLNGIMLETRRCIDVLSDAGLPAGEIHAAGWSAEDASVRRDLADCCRRPVRGGVQSSRDCSALGAARLLARALGHTLPDLGPHEPAIVPDEARSLGWDALWERHERLREATAAIDTQREVLCTET